MIDQYIANTCNCCQARENACGQNTIGFGLDSHWWRKWREFCKKAFLTMSVGVENHTTMRGIQKDEGMAGTERSY